MYACTDRLCHPMAFPPTEKKPETHKQTKNSTNLNTQKPTHKEHTNQHAKTEGQRDRAASCDGNKPHKNQQHPTRVHCTRSQVSALTAKSDSRGPLVTPGTTTNNSAATLHYMTSKALPTLAGTHCLPTTTATQCMCTVAGSAQLACNVPPPH
jgi:hypothetical protein